MRISISNYFVCPTCHIKPSLLIRKKTTERIIEGELRCEKCGRKFYIKNEILCFASCNKKQFERDIQKLRKTTIKQEIPKKWMQLYSKKEKGALKKEWQWMLRAIEKSKNAIHLDFATGTGRFLREIVSKTKGEIVAIDNGYGACQELQYFLKKIRKYSRVSIICVDARQMPFKDETFNSISSWYGIEELKMENSVKESKRVLKKGGIFMTSATHYPIKSKSFLLAKKHGIRLIIKEELFKIFKKNFFCQIEQKIFFKGYGGKKDFPIPVTGDFYLMYAIKAKKKRR